MAFAVAFAGAILSKLPGSRSPEAQSAIAAFEEAAVDLRNRIRSCASGRELLEHGFGRDVELAADRYCSSLAPILIGDAFVSE